MPYIEEIVCYHSDAQSCSVLVWKNVAEDGESRSQESVVTCVLNVLTSKYIP